jgi:hypothetical protein
MNRAVSGQWIDSPSGRIARAQELDSTWQQLWHDQYTQHPPDSETGDGMREQFSEDFRTWQQIKEQLSKMGVLSLMSPATGDLLDRWAVRARDWYERFKETGFEMKAPKPVPIERRNAWEGPTKLGWAIAGILGSAALLAVATHLVKAGPRSARA